jgi:hypothetical protein
VILAKPMSEFEKMIWHDNAIHGFHIRESGDNCNGELDFDIDYILEWLAPENNSFSFRVAPAMLTFHDVSDLIISINYAKITAAVQPMTIHEIRREVINYANGFSSFKWMIEINWPLDSFISFEASGFTQKMYGQQVASGAQYLQPSERVRL